MTVLFCTPKIMQFEHCAYKFCQLVLGTQCTTVTAHCEKAPDPCRVPLGYRTYPDESSSMMETGVLLHCAWPQSLATGPKLFPSCAYRQPRDGALRLHPALQPLGISRHIRINLTIRSSPHVLNDVTIGVQSQVGHNAHLPKRLLLVNTGMKPLLEEG